MKIQLVSGPIEEPVDERDFKDQARLEAGDPDEDTYIKRILKVARQYVENWTGRCLMDSTYDYWLDDWPEGNEIVLPNPRLIWTVADSLVEYVHTPIDTAGVITYTTSTWSTDEYLIDTDSTPGRIVLNYSKSWPTYTLRPYNPIRIRFDCGWTDPDDVPQPLKHAILLLATDMYEVRQDTIIGGVAIKQIDRVQHLIDDYCVNWL